MINNDTHHDMHSNNVVMGFILTILGGFIGAISLHFQQHPLYSLATTSFSWDFITREDVIICCVRSLIGAIIGLLVKLLYDFVVWLFKRKRGPTA